MRVRPIGLDRLRDELVERIASTGPDRLRVAIDGPPAARPQLLGVDLVAPLRARGRAAVVVRTDDFLLPASQRLEQGRTNPDAYYDTWVDLANLRREVLDPLAPGGTGRIIATRWDPVTDRATRAPYQEVPDGGVVIVCGAFLLGTGLPFDLTVHLVLSPAALARRTPPDAHWTLPAFDRYATEVAPHTFANVVVRLDDPRHPALVEPA